MSLEVRKYKSPPSDAFAIINGKEYVIYSNESKTDYNLDIDQEELMELLKFQNLDQDKIDKYVKLKEKEIENKILQSKKKVINGQNIFPLPNIDGRDCITVAGSSGAGKSTWIKKFSLIYKQIFPKRKIYLISSKDYDSSLEGVKIKKISITDESCDLLEWKFFKKSLLIVDDSFFKTEHQKCIDKLIRDILQIGRQDKISLIVSKHVLNNGQETKLLKCECNMFVMFPNHSPRNHIINYLKMNGFKKLDIEKVINTPSRWVAIRIQHPHSIITENEVRLY